MFVGGEGAHATSAPMIATNCNNAQCPDEAGQQGGNQGGGGGGGCGGLPASAAEPLLSEQFAAAMSMDDDKIIIKGKSSGKGCRGKTRFARVEGQVSN